MSKQEELEELVSEFDNSAESMKKELQAQIEKMIKGEV